jgi:hypothetical protein
MRSPWHEPIALKSIKDDWDSSPETPGVYIVMRDRPIPRIGGVDKTSILYIGKAKNLRERLWNFLEQYHGVTAFLWEHLVVAEIILNKSIPTLHELGKHLGELEVRYSTPISKDLLGRAERALIFTYIQRFGEPPPLNMNLPKRWEQLPPSLDREWAEKGLFKDV